MALDIAVHHYRSDTKDIISNFRTVHDQSRSSTTTTPLRITTDQPQTLYYTFSFLFLASIDRNTLITKVEVLGKGKEAHA